MYIDEQSLSEYNKITQCIECVKPYKWIQQRLMLDERNIYDKFQVSKTKNIDNSLHLSLIIIMG